MNREQLENNIIEIVDLYNNLQSSIQDLQKWLKLDWYKRGHLDDFLNFIWIEINDETRYAAYTRIANLHEESLVLCLEKLWFTHIEKNKKLDLAFRYVSDFYSEINAVLITVIQSKNLLTAFYLELIKWFANVWLAFNDFFLVWKNHIINDINYNLEQKFSNDSNKIINFLNENNLFDLWHNWDIADRCYSALFLEDWKYISKAYIDVFPLETNWIIEELDYFINNLSNFDDEIYNAKDYYIDYIKSIKDAFLESDINKLVEKWAIVDEKWMSIKTPFQIVHPLEYYEDRYRKAVAPEWDLRIKNVVFESRVEDNIWKMYETLFDEIGRENYKNSYLYSKSNINRVQLYLSSPVMYFWANLTWLVSTQVVPNDEVVSEKYWKKVFAFPDKVLKSKRSQPKMKLDSVIFNNKFLVDYRQLLFWKDEIFFKNYDILTIWHEFWHSLWLDLDTQSKMNKKTWSYKKIEEFKATTWGLVMHFIDTSNCSENQELNKNLIVDHIYRTIRLLKYREVIEIETYYCEALIHLDLIHEAWILDFLNWEDYLLNFNYSIEKYNRLKEVYLKHYKKLIKIYLDKKDVWEFLNSYTIKENWYYLPKNDFLRNFVNYYYDLYKKIWNDLYEVE